MTPTRQKWTSQDIPFVRNSPLHFMIGIFVLFFGLMAISPTDRKQWLAESLGLLVIVFFLVFSYKWHRFSNRSYLLMLIFFCLHLYAAHYTYEGTPFDYWLKNTFHTKRSQYDRVVHFCFGLLIAYPIREFLIRKVKIVGIGSYILTVFIILGFSAVFEIMEMLAASVAGENGEARFIGMQGDIFDTQKDMEVAFIGGILSIGILSWIHWRKRRH